MRTKPAINPPNRSRRWTQAQPNHQDLLTGIWTNSDSAFIREERWQRRRRRSRCSVTNKLPINIEDLLRQPEDRTYFLIRLPVHADAKVQLERGATPHVTPQVERLLLVCEGALLREELQAHLALKDRKHFRKAYLHPALDAGLIEMTIPEKPRSRQQRYRLTMAGRAIVEQMKDQKQTRS